MPTWLTILLAVLSTLTTLGILLGGIAYFIGTLRKSNAELWRQNSEAYEKQSAQKDAEIKDIRERLTDVEKELQRVKGENGEIVRLNVDMQLTLERKDKRIAELEALNAQIRTENSDLCRRVSMLGDPKRPA